GGSHCAYPRRIPMTRIRSLVLTSGALSLLVIGCQSDAGGFDTGVDDGIGSLGTSGPGDGDGDEGPGDGDPGDGDGDPGDGDGDNDAGDGDADPTSGTK